MIKTIKTTLLTISITLLPLFEAIAQEVGDDSGSSSSSGDSATAQVSSPETFGFIAITLSAYIAYKIFKK